MIALIEHGETVDLPDSLAGDIDQHRAVGDAITQQLLEHRDAVDPMLQRLFDVRFAHLTRLRAPRPVVGLANQIGNLREARGQLALIAGESHTVLDHRGNRVAMERRQPVVVYLLVHEADVVLEFLFAARREHRELGLDLEDLPEVLIVVMQQGVDVPRADHHDLDVDRHGLGLERDCGEDIQRIKGLDLEAAVAQRALQRRPDPGLSQHVHRVEHQDAAVGTQQTAGLDVHVIGQPLAAFRSHLLDRTEQIAVGRRLLPDDRQPAGLGVVDDDVDAKAVFFRQLATGSGVFFARFPPVPKSVQPLEHVLAHLVGIRLDPFDAKAIGDVTDRLFDQRAREVPVEFRNAPAQFAVHVAQRLAQRLHLRAEFLAPLGQPLEFVALELTLLDERFELVHFDRIPGDDRHERRARQRAHLHLHDGESLLLDLLLELLQSGFLSPRRLLDELRPAAPVLFGIEQARQVAPQRLQALVHRIAKPPTVAGGEDEQAWLVGVLEIADVDEIGGRFLAAIHRLQHARDDGRTTAPHIAGNEDVVALAAHRQADAQRLLRPVLADDSNGALVDVVRGPETEPLGVAAPAQVGGREAMFQTVGRRLFA